MYYIHKHEVAQQYGGPEEGGWWYDSGVPCGDWVPRAYDDEEDAYAACRRLNDDEHARREREEDYDYTSVLSHRSHHYSYSVEETTIMEAYPKVRPHYE